MSIEAGQCEKPFIRECTPEDIEELAVTMRPADVAEIAHASGDSPLRSLWMAFHSSDVIHTIEWKGRVVAIFGVVALNSQVAFPWMLGTEDLRRCWSLLRECRKLLNIYTHRYHYLTNAVWAQNGVHIKWITWLGFQFEGSDVRNGQTFLHFHRSINV